jgi:hypothetical protein
MPTLNGLFALALPHGFRARAFGVMQGGMQLTQGAAVLTTGLLAEHFTVPAVVGAWSVGGTLLMTFVAARWPSMTTFNAAITAAAGAATAAAASAAAAAPAPDTEPRATTVRHAPAGEATHVTPGRGV